MKWFVLPLMLAASVGLSAPAPAAGTFAAVQPALAPSQAGTPVVTVDVGGSFYIGPGDDYYQPYYSQPYGYYAQPYGGYYVQPPSYNYYYLEPPGNRYYVYPFNGYPGYYRYHGNWHAGHDFDDWYGGHHGHESHEHHEHHEGHHHDHD